jgi:signal transduction histidine kinase
MISSLRTPRGLCVLLLFCCTFTNAQNALDRLEIDALQELIDQYVNKDQDSAIALLEYALPRIQQLHNVRLRKRYLMENVLQRAIFYRHYGADSAQHCLERAHNYYRVNPNQKALAEIYYVYAGLEKLQNGYTPAALAYLDTAGDYALQQENLFTTSAIFYWQGFYLQMMERWPQSYEKVALAVSYAEASHDSLTLSASHFLLARVFQYYSMHCRAQDEIITALAYGKDVWQSARLLETLGDVHLKKGELPIAVETYTQAIHREFQYANRYKYIYVLKLYGKIGNAYLDASKWEKALETYAAANHLIADSIEAPLPKKYSFYYLFKARILSQLGEHNTAIALVDSSPLVKRTIGKAIRTEYIDYYKYAAQIMQNGGQHEKAFSLLLTWGSLKDSINAYTSTRQLKDIEKLYLKEKEKSEEVQLANKELMRGKRNQAFLGGGILLMLLCGGTTVYRLRAKSCKQKERLREELKEQQLGQILNAQEAERKRIARELHDGIGQSLAALKMQLQLAEKSDFSKQTISRVDALCREVRCLSHQMMPIVLQQSGIKDALHELVVTSLEGNGIKTDLLIHGFEARIDQQLEVHLYRITQELIANILKHAEATKVGVQLMQRENNILLVVEDNGKGMLNNAKGGLGTLNVKSRLESVGGKVEIESSVYRGTFIRITIPLYISERLTA